jgi:transcription initiation factor TFIIB
MDTSPEWRAFTPEERVSKSRVGAPTHYFIQDKGLSTTLGPIGRDAYGRKLSFSTKRKMWRLKKWQIRAQMRTSIARNLAQAMSELERLSEKLSAAKSVKERAALIYRKALDKGLVQGRSIAAIAAASLYAAFRDTGTPRHLNEVSKVSSAKRKEIARCYRLILRELEITMPTPDSITFLSKISESAKISGEAQGLAARILQEAKEKRISAGKNPIGFAAAALYLACQQMGEKKTQKEIGKAAGITEVTVRNRYKLLKKQLNL